LSEIDKLNEVEGREASESHQRIVELKYNINRSLAQLAIFLKESRDKEYYLSYADSWTEYLGTPEISLSRSYVHKLIVNYEIWVQTYHVSPAKLDEIDSEKLYLTGMAANAENYEEWLEKAKSLSRSDIKGLMNNNQYEYTLTCPNCGHIGKKEDFYGNQ